MPEILTNVGIPSRQISEMIPFPLVSCDETFSISKTRQTQNIWKCNPFGVLVVVVFHKNVYTTIPGRPTTILCVQKFRPKSRGRS